MTMTPTPAYVVYSRAASSCSSVMTNSLSVRAAISATTVMGTMRLGRESETMRERGERSPLNANMPMRSTGEKLTSTGASIITVMPNRIVAMRCVLGTVVGQGGKGEGRVGG